MNKTLTTCHRLSIPASVDPVCVTWFLEGLGSFSEELLFHLRLLSFFCLEVDIYLWLDRT